MLKSMTGYGKAVCELRNKKITIEIKSLNSKQLDLNTRIPGFYKEKELEMRTLISKELGRGKVEFNMYAEITSAESSSVINTELVKAYYKQLISIAEELNVDGNSDLLSVIMRLPDTLKTEREELDENEWKSVLAKIKKALQDIKEFRTVEGEALEKDIVKRVENIENLLLQVEPFEKQRLQKVKERILNNLKEFSDKEEYDKNRFEQELIYYLEKMDITEEKVRLSQHCKYFIETVQSNEGQIGKKLGFISQEIGREINTLGSKAGDSDMQKLVILMKDELEKIKEQVLNVL